MKCASTGGSTLPVRQAIPAVSVILPTYDREPLLPRAIASVLAQTWADFELIIVDDGSTDGTPELLRGLDDPRIRTLRQINRGVAAARNQGLGTARGTWVTFLDSDDEATEDWLATLMAETERSVDVGIVTAGAWVEEGSDARDRKVLLPLPSPLAPKPIRATAGCLAARRDLLLEIGGYAEELHYAENSELALRLLPACRSRGLALAVVDRPLVLYHRDPMAWRGDDRAFDAIRRSAEYILERHGSHLRSRFPSGYVNYRGVAAINAARLGDVAAARRHLRAALRVEPRRLRSYLRLALTFLPPLARRYWRRHGHSTRGADS